jgi:hypothetical protein
MEIPKLRKKQEKSPTEITTDTVSQTLKDNISALTRESEPMAIHSNHPKTPQEPRTETGETPSSVPAKSNGSANPGQRRVPTYKIALTSSLLEPARRSTSAAH